MSKNQREQGENSPQINRLIEFIQKEELVNNKRSKLIGNWYPIYGNNPEEYVPYFYDFFNRLKQQCIPDKGRKPRFVDCGSGYGTVGAIATLAGYESINIELQEPIHTKALEYSAHFVKEGIVEKDSMKYGKGSYYTPFFSHYSEGEFEYHYKLAPEAVHDGVAYAAMNLGLDFDAKYDEIIARMEALRPQGNIWADLGLMVQNDEGEELIDAEVIYSYPSDPFFQFGFVPQLEYHMKPGSLLVLPKYNSSVLKVQELNQFVAFHPLHLDESILVFEK